MFCIHSRHDTEYCIQCHQEAMLESREVQMRFDPGPVDQQMENRDRKLYPSIWTPVVIKEEDVEGQTLKTGEKKDDGKSRFELLPYDVLQSVADILTKGATKYDSRNWEKGIQYGRVFGAAQRHLAKFWSQHLNGSDGINHEDGSASHLDHAITELMFLSAYEKRGMKNFDDRPGKK